MTNTRAMITDEQHKAIDREIAAQGALISSPKQYVKGSRRGGIFLVGRYVDIKGERKPRLLSWGTVKIGD